MFARIPEIVPPRCWSLSSFDAAFVRKLVMAKSKNPPQNAVGTSHGVLRNQIGTLKGQLGTVGGATSKKPRNAKE
jgi:hypothetical protein